MNSLVVMGLVGEDEFAQLLAGMPDEFFRMGKPDQDAVWKAILKKVNEGVKDTDLLIIFIEEWFRLYRYFGIPQLQLD